MLLLALLLLGACDENRSKYVDMVQAPCAGNWRTVTVQIRSDSATIVAVCKP